MIILKKIPNTNMHLLYKLCIFEKNFYWYIGILILFLHTWTLFWQRYSQGNWNHLYPIGVDKERCIRCYRSTLTHKIVTKIKYILFEKMMQPDCSNTIFLLVQLRDWTSIHILYSIFIKLSLHYRLTILNVRKFILA